MAFVHAGSGFLTAVGEQLAAPGFAVEQLAQEAGDFALSGAGVENSAACAGWEWDEPGICSCATVLRTPCEVDTGKNHLFQFLQVSCVYPPGEQSLGGRDAMRGAGSPRGNRHEYWCELCYRSNSRLKSPPCKF